MRDTEGVVRLEIKIREIGFVHGWNRIVLSFRTLGPNLLKNEIKGKSSHNSKKLQKCNKILKFPYAFFIGQTGLLTYGLSGLLLGAFLQGR